LKCRYQIAAGEDPRQLETWLERFATAAQFGMWEFAETLASTLKLDVFETI
jgi:hypothetical protein